MVRRAPANAPPATRSRCGGAAATSPWKYSPGRRSRIVSHQFALPHCTSSARRELFGQENTGISFPGNVIRVAGKLAKRPFMTADDVAAKKTPSLPDRDAEPWQRMESKFFAAVLFLVSALIFSFLRSKDIFGVDGAFRC